MKLRNKVLLSLGLGLVSLSTSFYFISRTLLTKSYIALENQQVDKDVQRVLDILATHLDNISRQTRDYSRWDDSYKFIINRNSAYINSNFTNDHLTNLRLSAAIYINKSGRVVFSQGVDFNQKKEVPVSQAFLAQLSSSSPLLKHPNPKSEHLGFIQLPEGPMMLTSQPIVTSEGAGPIRGTLIMGRYLDQPFIQQLKELTKLPNIRLEPFDAKQLAPDFQAAQQAFAQGKTSFAQPLSKDLVAGYALLKDISDKPAFLLRVTEPRTMYARGQASLNYLVLGILLLGSMFSIAIIWFLEKSILSRLSALNADVSQIGTKGISQQRVVLPGSDELSNLATTFNSVLDRLEKSQTRSQAYAKGLQEHNTILAELSRDESLVQGNLEQAARLFVKATAQTLGITRVSIWLYNSDRSEITCLDLYNRTLNRHLAEMTQHQADFPKYFQALSKNEPIIVNDVGHDPRTRELAQSYLTPNNIVSLLDLPIQMGGYQAGIIRCEQVGTRRQWHMEEQTFVYSISSLLALALQSKILQDEVKHLLDVVLLAADGNLTAEAKVSDHITGLVADTFNRFIERLAEVLDQVLTAARQVSQGANQQAGLAETVATNAEQQAQSVGQVLNLTEQMENAAQCSAERATASNESLQTVSTTLMQGQQAIAALKQGIIILQEGTDRIVQRMKTLREFVGLADQFVQNQNQIAFITQTLSLNASLVAARASQQRDPRQFVVVAREFDSIADQVSKLAQQTSEGLAALEQQSTQIHTAVSAVDGDVQGLGDLVKQFTLGVEQSNQVFDRVQMVTGEAVQAGEAVTHFSQEIVEAAQLTAIVMQDIAELANKTAELTQVARERSDQMDLLSAQLLQTVQFFQLSSVLDKDSEAQPDSDAFGNSQSDHRTQAQEITLTLPAQ
ncbi:CHASE4 domain-containing protein [Allocoleopsis sp.]|uniref:CHASE4 domain-containing protein n=1 Tax=Allocoleopsis sp. TaxID=3088169 RepID=UPI002FCEF809